METISVMFKKGKTTVDTDRSVWQEFGCVDKYFLRVVRIFVEVGEGYVNQIGTCFASTPMWRIKFNY